MAKLDRSHYTTLLKNKHVKRSEINRKINAKKKRAIIRDLAQWYSTETNNDTEAMKLIRQHGIKIPRDISKDLWSFAGVRFFETPDIERKQIEYGKRLTGNVLPKESKIFKTNRIAEGAYVYIVEVKGYPTSSEARNKNKLHTRTVLMAFDRPVTKRHAMLAFRAALEGEDLGEFEVEWIDSPPLQDLLSQYEIKSWRVVGLMKGI